MKIDYTCPKCGKDNVLVKYIPEGTILNLEGKGYLKNFYEVITKKYAFKHHYYIIYL